MDISTNAAGLKLSSPLLPGSGPLTGDAERILYLARQGLGAIVTKTIAPEAAEVGRPCIAGNRTMIFNSEAWSEHPASQWIGEYLPEVRNQCDTPIIASVGYDDEDLKQMVPQLEPLVAGYEYIPRYVGKDFDEVKRIVAVLRGLTKKPVWVKMNANISDPVSCRESGADGIVAITSLGPNMVIDIEHRRPLIGTADGYRSSSTSRIRNRGRPLVSR